VDAKASDKYLVKRFTFENVWVETAKGSYDKSMFLDATFKGVKIVEPVK